MVPAGFASTFAWMLSPGTMTIVRAVAGSGGVGGGTSDAEQAARRASEANMNDMVRANRSTNDCTLARRPKDRVRSTLLALSAHVVRLAAV